MYRRAGCPCGEPPSPCSSFVAVAAVLPTVARADNDYSGGPDENRDLPTPGAVPADTRPSEQLTATATADSQMTIFAAAVARNPIDDFRYDALVLEGTARDVCAGRLLTGSGWTFNEIVGRFGGSAGTMYYCRERWDTATDPSCNGQQANPVTTPNFFSDVLEQPRPGPGDRRDGRQAGWRLQHEPRHQHRQLAARPRRSGQLNSNARKLGIQQILFADRCWNSDGDRGISSWAAMRAVRHRPPRPRPHRPDHRRCQRERLVLGARSEVRTEARQPGVLGPARRLAPGRVVVESGCHRRGGPRGAGRLRPRHRRRLERRRGPGRGPPVGHPDRQVDRAELGERRLAQRQSRRIQPWLRRDHRR